MTKNALTLPNSTLSFMQSYPADSTLKEDKTVNKQLCVILPNSLIVKEFNILSPVLSAMYNLLICNIRFLTGCISLTYCMFTV